MRSLSALHGFRFARPVATFRGPSGAKPSLKCEPFLFLCDNGGASSPFGGVAAGLFGLPLMAGRRKGGNHEEDLGNRNGISGLWGVGKLARLGGRRTRQGGDSA